MSGQNFVDWSSEWRNEGRVWVLNLVFEEDGTKFAQTTIECKPDDTVLRYIKQRSEEALGSVAPDILLVLVSDVINSWARFQLLEGTKPTENKF